MKTNQLKKLGLAIISAVMMFSSALGNLGIVSAKEVKYSIREYETGYKTDRGTNLLKLRIKGADIPDYGTHWGAGCFLCTAWRNTPKRITYL